MCLINAPTEDKPFNRTYTVQYLGIVVGGQPVRYLNVDMDTFRQCTQQTLLDGEAVWFGCDVGKLLIASGAFWIWMSMTWKPCTAPL